jgi:N-acetylneuraminate 9-O-acetyltransferase
VVQFLAARFVPLIFLPVAVVLYLVGLGRHKSGSWINDDQKPPLIVSGAVALIFIADRTGFWLKEQKEFNLLSFSFLSLTGLAIGLLTVKKADKDLGFLNREQTDEWKGWMQGKCLRLLLNTLTTIISSCYLDLSLHGCI